jgi:deoxycytidylate deaminase
MQSKTHSRTHAGASSTLASGPIVEQLARELEARRRERAGVVVLDPERLRTQTEVMAATKPKAPRTSAERLYSCTKVMRSRAPQGRAFALSRNCAAISCMICVAKTIECDSSFASVLPTFGGMKSKAATAQQSDNKREFKWTEFESAIKPFVDAKRAAVPEWDDYFAAISSAVSLRSKDPSRRVGAVIVTSDLVVVATGYNWLARGIKELPERFADKDEKYKWITHAETNAISTHRVPGFR